MCKILGVDYFLDKASLSCSEYTGDFSNATILKIVDKDGKETKIKDFTLETRRNCFSFNENKPWIVVDAQIGKDFCKIGNEIILI